MTKHVYTVGQVNAYIKNMFDQDFMLNRIYVKGEVSNCKYHTSGHIYFTLKDHTGAINGVLFAGNRKGLGFTMKNGDNVIALGSVSVYERDGKYQLYAREILPDGEGLLYRRFEQLKQELEEMGMFAPEYKQPIPRFIRTLGVVTADTGAAVRDIIQVAGRRIPYVQIILYPAIVQGEAAVGSIVRGIRALEALGVDVMIVGRGGGSIEDLWAFNEREVAQAIFDCTVPVISAVGHETDTTISDFAADLRAPTPSAAAELAVADIREILGKIELYRDALNRRMNRRMEACRSRAGQFELRLKAGSPIHKLRARKMDMLSAEERLQERMRRLLEKRRHELALYAERMKGLSPLDKLCRGYSYVEDEGGKNIRSVGQVREGQRLRIRVMDGQIDAVAVGTETCLCTGAE